jgi:hypothetical protein
MPRPQQLLYAILSGPRSPNRLHTEYPQSVIRRSIRLSTFFITHAGLGVRRNEGFLRKERYDFFASFTITMIGLGDRWRDEPNCYQK